MPQKNSQEIAGNSNDCSRLVTRKDLQRIALSDYLIREITRTLKWSYLYNRSRGYSPKDIEGSIQVKLSKPKTRKSTKIKLTQALDWLNNSNLNVIEVDFSPQSTANVERKINILKKRIECRQHRIESNMKVLEALQEEETLLKNSYEELMVKVNAAIRE